MPDIFFGQNTSFDLISKTHGRKRLKFVEAFEVDPSHTNKRLWFFNSKEALAISIFEGINGSYGYLETEEKFFLAMVMDQDPDLDVINDDPGAYLAYNILLNSRNESGKQRNAIFAKGCRIAGVPESMAPREEQHSRVSFIGSTRYKLKGGGIAYYRVLAATPDPSVFETDDDLNFDASGVVDIPDLPASINIYDPTTFRKWFAAYKNGEDQTQACIDDPTLFTVNIVAGPPITQNIALGAGAPLATDVWEFYIPYKYTS